MKNIFTTLAIISLFCGCTRTVYLESIPCVEGCKEPVCPVEIPEQQKYHITDVDTGEVSYIHKDNAIIRCTKDCK